MITIIINHVKVKICLLMIPCNLLIPLFQCVVKFMLLYSNNHYLRYDFPINSHGIIEFYKRDKLSRQNAISTKQSHKFWLETILLTKKLYTIAAKKKKTTNGNIIERVGYHYYFY